MRLRIYLPGEEAVGLAAWAGEIRDDDFLIVGIDVVMVPALDHSLAAPETAAPIRILVGFIFHKGVRPFLRRAGCEE